MASFRTRRRLFYRAKRRRQISCTSSRLEKVKVASEDVKGLEKGEKISCGCYGVVYKVRLHGLPCIAKRLHDILVGRGGEEPVSREDRRAVIDRFREECVLLSGLRHPNVVQFMGVHYGRDEADISLIMEYMHMDLDHCMQTYPNIPLPYKTSILRDVAYGLAYLHSIPIMHRDLNAGNVLLTESLRAKITDFGVAKPFDGETSMLCRRTLCPGAQVYMPPECLGGSLKYNAQLDVFSFGHLTIYLANQEAPVITDEDFTEADVRNEQIEVGKHRMSLDKMGGPDHPLYSIAVHCLSDTPDQRPTSRDLVRRMEELCKNQPQRYRNMIQQEQKISELEEQLLQKSKENDDLLMKNKIIEEQNANQIQEMADCAGEINDKQQKIDTMNKEMVDPKKKKKKKKSKSRKNHATVECCQNDPDACLPEESKTGWDRQEEVKKTDTKKKSTKGKFINLKFRNKSRKRKRGNAQLNSSSQQPTGQHERHLYEQVSKRPRIEDAGCTDHLSGPCIMRTCL